MVAGNPWINSLGVQAREGGDLLELRRSCAKWLFLESVRCRGPLEQMLPENAELEKLEETKMGAARKIKPQSLRPVFSLCRRSGSRCHFSEIPVFSRVHPPWKLNGSKINQNIEVASAKVAFDIPH